MKVTPEHVSHMKAMIVGHDVVSLREAYKAAGLTDKRYRWDLSYRAGLTPWICDNIYSYADDTHLDTALRSIVPPL
jgi:hypothetical protein